MPLPQGQEKVLTQYNITRIPIEYREKAGIDRQRDPWCLEEDG